MRNVTGAPVEDQDFFERPRELARLLEELENRANLRINAARRVGKTSLVLRLCREWETRRRKSVFLNVEDTTDELSFTEKLLESLQKASLQPSAVTRCQLMVSRGRKAMGLSKITTGLGMDLDLGTGEDQQTATLGRAVEKVFEEIEREGKSVLIAIDEMPEVLLALSGAIDGAQRVSRLLHWLRNLRQTYRQNIRWVFLGSIGLEGFVEDRLLGKTINDLTPFALDALSEKDADSFLNKLGDSYEMWLSPELRRQIIGRVGWPLPHHLQIVFHALRDSDLNGAESIALDQAFSLLLGPGNLSQFDTWRQKLDEQFDSADAALSKLILNHICQHSGGRSREQILVALMAGRPEAHPDELREKISQLLQLLQRDGYLLEKSSIYNFRSFLLRDYWYRRNIA